jgi:pimeloyl-ACP methyl ester carboxylesterase
MRRASEAFGVVVLAIALLFGPGGAMSAEAASPQPRGQMVDIGAGRRLHIVCAGPAAGGRPTVLLEAGAFGFSADWAAVQAKLADVGLRSCAYDRAGLGFSDPGPPPRDSGAIVDDLEALLAAEGETGPFILCGHSMAGLHLRVLAARDPSRVVGVVLVDAVTPEAMDEAAERQGVANFNMLAQLASLGAASGLLRPLGASFGDSIGLPPQAKAEKHWAFGNPRHNRWAAAESEQWPQDAAEAEKAGPYDPDWPVAVILTGDERSAGPRQATESAPAKASRQGFILYVPGANHATLLGETYGGRIVEAILDVEAAAKEKAS